MLKFSTSIIFLFFCFSCVKKEAEVEKGNTISPHWSWRSSQSRPLVLSGNLLTFAGFPGDMNSADGFGLYASFSQPSGITNDGTHLYVADYGSSTIRKINIRTQEVTTLAGQLNVYGHANGVGTNASFTSLWMITTDGKSLFITDASCIRKIDLVTEEVTTFAGSPNQTGNADGFGISARFSSTTTGITTDGTNLFVSDGNNNTIRKIVISTGEVSTLAGSMTPGSANGVGTMARFLYPWGLSTDGTDVYVADSNKTIRKINILTKMVSTLAGETSIVAAHTDGRGRFARFSDPFGIADDGTNLYVTENVGCTIRKIVKSTGEVTTLSGLYSACNILDGIGIAARTSYPYGITTDGTSLYIVEGAVVRKME